MITRLAIACCCSTLACHAACIMPGGSSQPAAPWEAWEVTLESGCAWNLDHSAVLSYKIVPTQLTIRGPRNFTLWENHDGGLLVVRPRISLLAEAIVSGAEDHYFGISLSPSFEYWFPARKTSLWFSVGGGAGVINSGRDWGGQGQDLTLNFFVGGGIRQALTEDLSLLGGFHYLHHSNGGMTRINPGINVCGFMLGLSRRF